MVDQIPTINEWECGLLCHSHSSPTLYYQWPNWLRTTLPLAQQKHPPNATNASTITVKLLKTGSNWQCFFGLFVCCCFFHALIMKKICMFSKLTQRTIATWPPTQDIIVMQVLLFYSLLQSLYCSSVYSAVRIICFHKKPKKDNRKIRFNSPLHNTRIHFVPTV